MGGKENTVTGSHKWELDGCGVSGQQDWFFWGGFAVK